MSRTLRRAPHTVSHHAWAVYCGEPPEQPSGCTPETLERLVLRALVNNVQDWCPWLLQALGPDHLSVALENLSLDLPLVFCIRNVPDGFYWQRRALHNWPDPENGMCDVSRHGDSWRRLVLERHLQTLLEQCTPSAELPQWLRTELRDAAPHVRCLVLRELQAGFVATDVAHLPLGPVVSLLPELQVLHVKMGPRECGLDFSWPKFTLTAMDANSLGQGLLSGASLTVLRVCSSHVTDDTLALVLRDDPGSLPRLTELDLSHNELQDGAAAILATFIRSHPALVRLRLVNNRMGADTLAGSLTSGLRELDLSLNALGEEGGVALLGKSARLVVLRVAGCALGPETARTFTSTLAHSDLHTVDLSNNQLGGEAGIQILNCLEKRKSSLQQLDLRMADIHEDVRHKINQILNCQ